LRLDITVELVKQLIDHVHELVRKADAMHTDPSSTIKCEHQEAEARIQERKNKYSADLFDPVKNRSISVSVLEEREIRRKLTETELERCFFPLATVQMMRLLKLSKSSAEQYRKRYRDRLSKLLMPVLSEQDKEILRELNILNEEEEDDD